MVALIIKLLAISFAFHFYKNRYPTEYQAFTRQIFDYIENNESLKPMMPYLVKIGYAVIYVYSFCQIALNKVIQFTTPYVKMIRDKIMPGKLVKSTSASNSTNNTNITDNSKKTVVSFYNNGSLIKQNELAEFSSLSISDIQDCQPPDVLNLVTITDASDGVSNILTFIPKECKYDLLELRFIALYLKHDDKTHIIELCKDNRNYYVAGNCINSAFLQYYLKNVLNVQIDNSKPFVYTLELMDHNVQMVYLDETQAIVFQKDGYSIEEVKSEAIKSEEEVKEAIKEEIKEEPDLIEVQEEITEEVKSEATESEEPKEEVQEEAKEEVSVDDDYDDLPELINVEAEEEVEAVEAVEVVKEKQE